MFVSFDGGGEILNSVFAVSWFRYCFRERKLQFASQIRSSNQLLSLNINSHIGFVYVTIDGGGGEIRFLHIGSCCLHSMRRSFGRDKNTGRRNATLLRFAAPFESLLNDGKKQSGTIRYPIVFWRRRRDSNSRTAYDRYTISNRAPSTKLGDSSKTYAVVCFNSVDYYTASTEEMQAFFSRGRIYLFGFESLLLRPAGAMILSAMNERRAPWNPVLLTATP